MIIERIIIVVLASLTVMVGVPCFILLLRVGCELWKLALS